jgi:hypothetical protein
LHPLQLETPSPTVDGYRPIGFNPYDFIFYPIWNTYIYAITN